jgi:hypothetical protein
MDDGITDDPTDIFKLYDVCDKCGGGGVVPLDKARIKEPSGVDQIAADPAID